MSIIEIIKADITKLKVDAIVNAANKRLAGGGGVDGAIHRAAGKQLSAACSKIGFCNTGEAVITPGFLLPSKYIIHTVGPVWRGGLKHEPELLAKCYTNSLKLAADNNINTIAFPNISTGVYGYPKKEAARIAISSTKIFAMENTIPERIIFVCFDDENYKLYHSLLS